MLPSRSELQAERARRSLSHFVEIGWEHVDYGSAFVPGFHLDAICDHLEAVARGEIQRLLINVPPRHGKSTVASVLFPAWVWASDPSVRFLFASYGIELATRDSLRTRRLLESDWYRRHFGQTVRLAPDQNEKTRFETTRGGLRLATSVGGSATGEGGEIIVIDDPLKIEGASSAALRQSANEWLDLTISTRLNDPRTGGIVIIGQRLHEDDPFGHKLVQGGWTHLCLPAQYDPDHPHLWPDDPRSQPGELLWPARIGPDEIATLTRELGSYGAAGQLQQLPAPATGGIFKREWWNWHDPSQGIRLEEIVQSWDLAFTGGPSSDPVVGQAWGINGADKYLLGQVRDQLSFTETIDAIRQFTEMLNEACPGYANHLILIEEAANGAAVIDVLRAEIAGVIAVRPQGDKIGRAHAVSPQIEAGNVYLPGAPNAYGTGYDRARTPAWVQELVEEAAQFPNGRYDDQVDALTQLLSRGPGPRARWIG